MNKLDVALKLLQLLNERKTIDSKSVAKELNVSIRTAQRYLVELSILPCVASRQNDHSYSLSQDYALSDALIAPPHHQHSSGSKIARKLNLRKTVCLLCGESRTEGSLSIQSDKDASNVARLDKLAAVLYKRMRTKSNRCTFP